MIAVLEGILAFLSVAGLVGSLLFLALYHHSARWWAEGYGRSLFMLAVVIGIFFSTSVAYNIFGDDYPGRSAARVTTLIIGSVTMWYLLITLMRGSVAARRRRHREGRGRHDHC